jgi:hypothetical protein
MKVDHALARLASGKRQKLQSHAKRKNEMYHSMESRKDNSKIKKSEPPKGKIEIWEYLMGKGWLLVILCTVRLLFLVLLLFFLCYQDITIVVI